MSEEKAPDIHYAIPTSLDGVWAAVRLKSEPGPKLGYLTTQRIGEALFMRIDIPNATGATRPEVFPIDDIREIVLSDLEKVMSYYAGRTT